MPDDRRRYEELATLAGGLAHEIKNPLSTIGLNLELLAEELEPENARAHRLLAAVQRECGRLGEVLESFLRFARAGTPQTEPADLNAVVRDFLEFFRPTAEAAGVTPAAHFADDLPPVPLDAKLFRQVLMNLALNAVQAMPDGGRLEFDTRGLGIAVELSVTDTGGGIDAETRAKMFDPFWSEKPGGSGLGLPTVRKIVEAHGGRLVCESGPGTGTRFGVTLPVA